MYSLTHVKYTLLKKEGIVSTISMVSEYVGNTCSTNNGTSLKHVLAFVYFICHIGSQLVLLFPETDSPNKTF